MSRILLVEDDPAVREVVEHALSQEGVQTVAVRRRWSVCARRTPSTSIPSLMASSKPSRKRRLSRLRSLRSHGESTSFELRKVVAPTGWRPHGPRDRSPRSQ
jgi:DNA-binding response OmpR family regulator